MGSKILNIITEVSSYVNVVPDADNRFSAYPTFWKFIFLNV